MDRQTCKRCDGIEHIPTHQYVKVDDKVHYLCGKCWNAFRSWLFWMEEKIPTRQQRLY